MGYVFFGSLPSYNDLPQGIDPSDPICLISIILVTFKSMMLTMCYGQIQGIGAILVDRIEGSFDNVVGLPLRPTLALIEKVLQDDDESIGEFAEGEEE